MMQEAAHLPRMVEMVAVLPDDLVSALLATRGILLLRAEVTPSMAHAKLAHPEAALKLIGAATARAAVTIARTIRTTMPCRILLTMHMGRIRTRRSLSRRCQD